MYMRKQKNDMSKSRKNRQEADRILPRDVSWMYFNRRILQEAGRKDIPLLERLSFLGIYSNNLDEFFRVRVASLNRIVEYEDKTAKEDKKDALSIIKEINKLNNIYSKEFEAVTSDVMEDLAAEGICVVNDSQLDEEQVNFVLSYYRENLYGWVLPVRFSAVRQFDMENDESIYLAVRMHKKNMPDDRYEYAFLDLPVSICGRFVRLPDKDGKKYLMYLDDVIRCSLPLIFSGQNYDGFDAYSFKFTRDAEMEIDNDVHNGLLQKISKGLKDRKKGSPLRVIYDENMPPRLLKYVLGAMNLDKLDTVLAGGRYHNHKDFMGFPDCGRKDLKYPKWKPVLKSELSDPETSILELIKKEDRFIHVPYHSFDSYLRVLQEAALSKDVTSIRITLYRLAKESKVVKALIGAARNGKKVIVVIELMARFDEASNINWSKRMQDAGIHVIFGVEGLKVHSKITHISMKNGRDIACISTGNFHESNAKVYTDYIMMTASKPIVKDVLSVFNFIEKPYAPVSFKELLVSPNTMRNRFVHLINDEIKNKNAGKPAYIKVKINHITDPLMVRKLYEAAENGVKIDLLVRGNCSLYTDSPKLEGNMRVTAIIDRYLEHSRIFIFAAGGEEKTFIGSADWMPRNLDNRVEVIAPVYDPKIKADLKRVVELGLNDNVQGRVVDGYGRNEFFRGDGNGRLRSQEFLYDCYLKENEMFSSNGTSSAEAEENKDGHVENN